MIRLMIALAPLLLVAGTAAAQDHSQHGAPARPPAQAPGADPHAGHAMPAPAQTADLHAGNDMGAPSQAPDPHAGHAMPAQADPHAGHDMSGASPGPSMGPPDVPTSAEDEARPRHPPPQ